MKEVNLEEILKSIEPNFNPVNVVIIKIAMKQACEQTIDLCAENAILDLSDSDIAESFLVTDDTGHSFNITVQKQSILNTKNQIK